MFNPNILGSSMIRGFFFVNLVREVKSEDLSVKDLISTLFDIRLVELFRAFASTHSVSTSIDCLIKYRRSKESKFLYSPQKTILLFHVILNVYNELKKLKYCFQCKAYIFGTIFRSKTIHGKDSTKLRFLNHV